MLTSKIEQENFITSYNELLEKIAQIDPVAYSKSRNFTNGAVTRLSPYLSRGIISTKQLAASLLKRNFSFYEAETFLKELCWRDYFQQVWKSKGDAINQDLKQSQLQVDHNHIPSSLVLGQTGIKAIDQAIEDLYSIGYMHNHLRMYVAAIACNVGRSHWLLPARWMYYYLLDADWASNALSWQWVAGSFSSKKYFANQENINTYTASKQRGTFLDIPYEAFDGLKKPEVLNETLDFTLKTKLPEKSPLQINSNQPTYLYNFYNLDPNWDTAIQANRILLLEPGFFERYPIADHSMHFLCQLAKQIPDIQLFVGEFDELKALTGNSSIHFKEHPTSKHYQGIQHERDWLVDEVQGYFPSFSAYWKKCEGHLRKKFLAH